MNLKKILFNNFYYWGQTMNLLLLFAGVVLLPFVIVISIIINLNVFKKKLELRWYIHGVIIPVILLILFITFFINESFFYNTNLFDTSLFYHSIFLYSLIVIIGNVYNIILFSIKVYRER